MVTSSWYVKRYVHGKRLYCVRVKPTFYVLRRYFIMKSEPSIVDDFMYSTNVAGSSALVRLGSNVFPRTSCSTISCHSVIVIICRFRISAQSLRNFERSACSYCSCEHHYNLVRICSNLRSRKVDPKPIIFWATVTTSDSGWCSFVFFLAHDDIF